MSEKEINKLVRQVKKIDKNMTKLQVLSGILLCKLHNIEISPASVYSGYKSFNL